MKKQNRELTKAMLLEWGFHSINWDADAGEWWIDRYWYKNTSKQKRHIRLKVNRAVCKHKYTQNKEYPVISFSVYNKAVCLPLARIIYAWFKEDIPEGMVIDHIDNNPFNNWIENLQMLTPDENLQKRFIDNPNANRNQWDAIKKSKLNDKIVEKYYIAQAELVNATNRLTELAGEQPDQALESLDKITNYLREI